MDSTGRAHRRRLLVGCGGAVMALLLAACSGSPEPEAGASSTPTASTGTGEQPSASGSPTPDSTLTAQEQQAFEEATAAVLAYRQTITDLYSGARTDLNDLNDVATGELLDQGLKNISKSLNEGWFVGPPGVQVSIASSEALSIRLDAEPPEAVVRVCLDATTVTETDPDGNEGKGIREVLNYTVVRNGQFPGSGWAVSGVSTETSGAGARAC